MADRDREFEEAHAEWLESHKRRRSGDRLKRLIVGHAYLEKLFLKNIWWPAFGSFEYLHPEYEVEDFKDGKRYIDNAYIPPFTKMGLEADGFETHVKNVTRSQHADNLMRDAHLTADGWTMLHFSSDLIESRPRQVQQVLQQIIWGRERKAGIIRLTPREYEVLRMARAKGAPITPAEISVYMSNCYNTTKKLLTSLVGKGMLKPFGNTKVRIMAYELTREGFEILQRLG